MKKMYITTVPVARQEDALVGQSVYTYHLIKNNSTTHTRAATRRRNMIKQRICGVIMVLCGVVPMIIDKDATAFIFLAMFYLPMIFGKQYIMTFKE